MSVMVICTGHVVLFIIVFIVCFNQPVIIGTVIYFNKNVKPKANFHICGQ